MLQICLSCLGVGFLLGVVIQRGFFCMYNGFANMTITKDFRIIKAAIWTFILTLVAFHLLSGFGVITFNPKPFFWIGSVVGALVFSIGMVLSGSCIVGTPLRAASGRLVYWLGLLGMGLGGWLTIWGPVSGFRTDILQKYSEITLGGSAPTLDVWLGVNSWIIVVVLVAIGAWLLHIISKKENNSSREEAGAGSSPKEEEKQGSFIKDKVLSLWSPLVIGIGLAVVEVLAFISGKSPAGLGGFIKGWGIFFKAPFTGELSLVSWPAIFVLGILIGVFVSALAAKEFRVIKPKSWGQSIKVFSGGLLMGMGAVTAAGGCNVAHIFSHMPQLSIGSFVSGLVIVIATPLLVKYFVVGGKL